MRLWRAAAIPAYEADAGRMNLELAALAAAQGGLFTRKQALASGYRGAQIRALTAGEWVQVRRGVYAVRTAYDALTPAGRHVLQAAAYALASRLSPVVSHRTGALAHSLPLLGSSPAVPQLTRAPRSVDDTSRTEGLYVASLSEADRTTVGGVPVTSLARTACDIARTSPLRHGVVVADAVLRRLVPPEDLLAVATAQRRWPGGTRAVQVARLADGRAETPLESLTRLAYLQEGLPAPESQIEVLRHGVLVARVDFLFRGQRTIGEADGMGKYDEPGALRLEKRREEDLRRCGLDVVRSTWDDVWRAAGRRELAQRMREAFGYMQGRQLADGVTFRVPTLEELVRRERRAA